MQDAGYILVLNCSVDAISTPTAINTVCINFSDYNISPIPFSNFSIGLFSY